MLYCNRNRMTRVDDGGGGAFKPHGSASTEGAFVVCAQRLHSGRRFLSSLAWCRKHAGRTHRLSHWVQISARKAEEVVALEGPRCRHIRKTKTSKDSFLYNPGCPLEETHPARG